MLKFATLLLAAMTFAAVTSGCGYTLQGQGTTNPLIDRYDVRKVYVLPLGNTTFKPGVESVVYNELLRVISANRRVSIVNKIEDADAVLSGTVDTATADRGGSTGANNLFPPEEDYPWVPRVSNGLLAATSYNAVLGCQFSLALVDPETLTPSRELWNGGFSRTKTFPGNNQLGAFGNTGALINESEFDRALSEAARSMVYDVHESMLAMF